MANNTPVYNKEKVRQKIISYLWNRSAKNQRDFSFRTKKLPFTYPNSYMGKIIRDYYEGNLIKRINENYSHGYVFKTQFWKNTR